MKYSRYENIQKENNMVLDRRRHWPVTWNIFPVFSQDAPEKEAIHLAVIDSGDVLGKAVRQGVQLYIDMVNQQEGIKGIPIALDFFDDQNDSELAEKRALEIVEQNRAVAVIGHIYSSCSLQAGPMYKTHSIPAVSPASTNVQLTRNNEWYFRTVSNDKI